MSGERVNLEDLLDRIDLLVKIELSLLDTWQPVACIAARCDISAKMALSLLLSMRDDGKVLMSKVRIDGHNQVHAFKRAKYRRVLGMRVVDSSSDVEEL